MQSSSLFLRPSRFARWSAITVLATMCAFCATPATAAQEITIEIEGFSIATGGSVLMTSEANFSASDSLEFPAPDGPIDVLFPSVTPGFYTGQSSPDEGFWSDVTPLIYHPSAGTLAFNNDPGAPVTVFYRLLRQIEPCREVTIRNTGDLPLTGISASLAGPGAASFTLDDSGLTTSLAPGESTTLTVCYIAVDTDVHTASLIITSNDTDENPFTITMVGDNDPGPIQAPLPTITVFTDRVAFESTLGSGKFLDDFSGNKPLLPVTSARGEIDAGKWADITQDPEPSTVWSVPFGTTGWGGTWDLTVGGVGGGITVELDFGGGNILTVPGHIPPGSPAKVFFGITTDQPFFAVRVRQFDSAGNTTKETHSFDDMTVQFTASGEIAVHNGATTAAPQLTDGQSTPVDFGTMARDGSATQTFTIANSGAEFLTVIGFRGSGAALVENAPATPFTIAAGGSANFDVRLTTTGGGSYFGEVAVFTTDADETRFNFPVTATVPFVREIEITNTQNNSPVVAGQAGVIHIEPNPFGGGSSVSFTVKNTGLDPLTISNVSLPPGFVYGFSIPGFGGLQAPRSIPPGGAMGFSVTSTGPTQGVYSGTVTLTNDDADEGEFSFPIRALFNMPEIEVLDPINQPILDGGALDLATTPLGQDKQTALRVRNLHSGPLTVTGVTLPNGYQLGAFAPTFPFTLGRLQIKDIPIVLKAQTPGTYNGTASILNNDDDESSFDVQLTGIVSEESITFLGFNLFINEGQFFGAAAFGSGPVTYEWDLDNDGQFDDAIGASIDLPDTDGPGTFQASLRMTDNLTSLVRSITDAEIRNNAPLITGTLPSSLIAGQTLALEVSANDASADLSAGMTWRIDWGDGVIDTTPAGHAPDTAFNHNYTQPGQALVAIEATDKDGGTGSAMREIWIFSAVIGVFDGPDTTENELRDGQDSLSFSTALGASQDRPLTVLNRGATSATIGPITLPDGFSLVTPPSFPATLASGEELTLTLRFAPTMTGTVTGNFEMPTSDPAMTSFEIALTGVARAPNISVSEFSGERFDFASGEESFSLFPGVESFHGTSFHFESTDSRAPLIITGIDLPSGFQIRSAPTFPIDFSEQSSTDLRIQCAATATGVYKGWVIVRSNDPDEAEFRFFVSARVGDVADLLVKIGGNGDSSSATGIVLNGQPNAVDVTASPTLRLVNLGNQSLTVSAVSLPDGFAFTTPPTLPVVLQIFGNAALPEIILTATEPGTHTGIISITSSDPDENPYQFTITGTVPGGEPQPLRIVTFTIVPASAGTVLAFSGSISGPPNATVIVEGRDGFGNPNQWTDITTVILDSKGQGTVVSANASGTEGATRYFVRLRITP